MKRCLLLIGCFAGTACAGSWLNFVDETSTRLVLRDPTVGGPTDMTEKNLAAGDLDQDGWVDVVMVRKVAWTGGKRTNLLLRNENGVLVDRTQEYAFQSDVPGDLGFLTATDDRDVILADVTGDGWLDVITATSFGHGDPKTLSHPRIYVNLGLDDQGDWLGLRYEAARVPQFLTINGLAVAPRFTAVAAGDLDGDGDLDLYFSDHDNGTAGATPAQPIGHDLNERALYNLGDGHFVDQTSLHVPTNMLSTAFGTSCAIRDLNGDNLNEIVRISGVQPNLVVLYNNPSNPGFVTHWSSQVGGGLPYYLTVGDLNRDQRLDLFVVDDTVDAYLLNTGADAQNRITWSKHAVPASTDDYGGQTELADLDNDGWLDVIIADVDIDVPGCDRQTDILRNLGGQGAPHSALFAQAADGVNLTGIPDSDLNGVHDVAVLDVDRDGRLDILLAGGCANGADQGTSLGLQVKMNRTPGLLVGDLDGDGDVDLADLGALLADYGCSEAPCSGDVDGDGDTDLADLGGLLSHYGA